jgi:hypothetical protein
VTFNVDRAIDERKPLLSLFVAEIAVERGVAWDALGKYTERGSEQHIGWHFNWGDPQQPVKYASVAEYRVQNLDPDVIRKRIDQGPRPRCCSSPPRTSPCATSTASGSRAPAT